MFPKALLWLMGMWRLKLGRLVSPNDRWFAVVDAIPRCSPWCRGLITSRFDTGTGRCVYTKERGRGQVQYGSIPTLWHGIRIHPKCISGLLGKVLRGRRRRGRRGASRGGCEIVVPPGPGMEHVCTICCHGGWYGSSNADCFL